MLGTTPYEILVEENGRGGEAMEEEEEEETTEEEEVCVTPGQAMLTESTRQFGAWVPICVLKYIQVLFTVMILWGPQQYDCNVKTVRNHSRICVALHHTERQIQRLPDIAHLIAALLICHMAGLILNDDWFAVFYRQTGAPWRRLLFRYIAFLHTGAVTIVVAAILLDAHINYYAYIYLILTALLEFLFLAVDGLSRLFCDIKPVGGDDPEQATYLIRAASVISIIQFVLLNALFMMAVNYQAKTQNAPLVVFGFVLTLLLWFSTDFVVRGWGLSLDAHDTEAPSTYMTLPLRSALLLASAATSTLYHCGLASWLHALDVFLSTAFGGGAGVSCAVSGTAVGTLLLIFLIFMTDRKNTPEEAGDVRTFVITTLVFSFVLYGMEIIVSVAF